MRPVVVTSVPLTGPIAAAGADAAAAAQLALDDAGAPAEHRIVDSRPEEGAPQTLELVRAVAGDPAVVAYLGDWHSRWSLTSLPVLEVAGLAQISFTNTSSGLAGASFFNVMPNDDALAADLVSWMIELGVERPFLLNWDERYGLDMRLLVHRCWAATGRRIAGAAGFAQGPEPPGALGDADAVFFGAAAEPAAAAALEQVHARAPAALLFGLDGLNHAGFAAALPGAVRGRLRIGSAALRGERLPAPGRAVLARLAASLGHEPDPHAVYAYEAMALALDALAAAGPDRAGIVRQLKRTRGRESVLGRYDLDAHGATTVGRGGRLVADGARLVPA